MGRIVDEINFVRRETPKIDGSSTAFIVVVVILVAIILTSCSAVIYLLRKSAAEDQEAQRRRRYNTQPLGDRDQPSPWYSKIRDWYNRPRFDNPETIMGRSHKGWIQTNEREWDSYSTDDRALRSGDDRSIPLPMSELGSPIVGPHNYTPRMHSPVSDAASSIRDDPHDIRGLPYHEPFALSPHATIPSIQSQLYSPTSSSSPSPVPRILKPPEPIAITRSHHSSYDSVRDSPPQSAVPALRTFGGGTKFIEGL